MTRKMKARTRYSVTAVIMGSAIVIAGALSISAASPHTTGVAGIQPHVEQGSQVDPTAQASHNQARCP